MAAIERENGVGCQTGQVRRVERASRTSEPSRILSSHWGQTRGFSVPFGVNTLAYAAVTNAPQFWHSGMGGPLDRMHIMIV